VNAPLALLKGECAACGMGDLPLSLAGRCGWCAELRRMNHGGRQRSRLLAAAALGAAFTAGACLGARLR
jgi:hypothetical protein